MRVLLAITIGLFATFSYAQDEIADAEVEEMFGVVRELLQAGREEVIAEELGMTSEERVGFWPIYDEYVRDLGEVNDRLAELLVEHSATWENVSDELAERMIDEYFDIESDRINVRSKYVRRFDNVLPPKKLARFIQIENKFNVLVELELAQAVPLIQ